MQAKIQELWDVTGSSCSASFWHFTSSSSRKRDFMLSLQLIYILIQTPFVCAGHLAGLCCRVFWYICTCYILIHGWKANKHMHACKCSVASMSAVCAAEARSVYTYTTGSSLRVTHRVSHMRPEIKTELAWREQWGSLNISAFLADSWSWITWRGLWS